MTVSGNTTITLPYEHIDIDFSSIEEGDLEVNAPNATVVKLKWAGSVSEEGGSDSGNTGDTIVLGTKYLGCKTVDEVRAVDANYLTTDIVDGAWTQSLADLGSGEEMFYESQMASFTSDLSNLGNGYCMFYNSALASFSSDLPNLGNGMHMFQLCDNLTTFSSDLPSLTNGYMMFYESGIESFSSDLSSLTNGYWMFKNCDNLTSFSSDLSSLQDGFEMFRGCKLDTASVQNIADTIKTVNTGEIHIDIGNTTPNEQEDDAFNTIASKGWVLYVYGSYHDSYGSGCSSSCCASLTTLDETGQEITTPIPFYAKPVACDEERAQYVDAEGNFFNILGGQFIYGDDLSTYGMFINEEDAAANMRLKKIGAEEIETA